MSELLEYRGFLINQYQFQVPHAVTGKVEMKSLWRVLAIQTNRLVKDGLRTEEDARSWVDEHLKQNRT